MPERSTKPYLIRAIHEWCTDSGYTPYLSVKVDENTRVPMEFVKNGEIVLNLAYDATHKLTIGNDAVQFAARFSGVSRECTIPMAAVAGIFARENGQGLFFAPETDAAGSVSATSASASTSAPSSSVSSSSKARPEPETPPPTIPPRPKLQIVK
jgi:stringent starvation protein B